MVFSSMVNEVVVVLKGGLKRCMRELTSPSVWGVSVVLMLMVHSQSALAYFDFIKKDKTTWPIDLSVGTDNTISFHFEISLKAKDGDKNSKQGSTYSLAVSPNKPTNLKENEKKLVMPPDFDGTSLAPYIMSVGVPGVGKTDAGNWSPRGMLKTTTTSAKNQTIILELNRKKLVELASKGSSLSFYLAGVSTGSEMWTDYILITIPLKHPAQVKISGLSDAKLPGTETPGDRLETDIKFCVYSSLSPYEYKIKFRGDNHPMGTEFMLMADYSSKSKAGVIPYHVQFKEKTSSGWEPVSTVDTYLSKHFKGSAKENCSDQQGTNAQINIAVIKSEIQVPPGEYQDTLEITVEAT